MRGIGIAMCTYNGAQFLRAQLDSILSQKLSPVEIIIVDDCSNDETFNIIKKLSRIDQRIKVFRNASNLKIVETLNFAFSVSKGEFIARMDGDDISDLDRIKKQFEYLIYNDIDLLGTNVILIDENDNFIAEETYLTSHNDINKVKFLFSPIPHFWLAKRKVYEALKGYRIPTVEDYDFVLRAMDFKFVVGNHPEFLYSQRIRSGNTSTKFPIKQYYLKKYVKKLAKEREKKVSKLFDSYSENELKNLESQNTFIKFFFEKSFFFSNLYNKNRREFILIAFIYKIISISLLPIVQFSEIYSRFRYKMYKNRRM